MDGDDWILRTQGNTAVDYLLTAPLHFGVASLHRSEIERLIAFARVNTGGGSAPEPNQHRRPAQNDQLCAGRNNFFLHMALADIAKTARNHDGLVVSVAPGGILPGCSHLEGAEVSRNIRPAELVIE